MKKEKNVEIATENIVEPVAEQVSAAPKVEAKINKVGSLLKEMRLKKDLKIADISKKLCIRKSYLESIEESNYAEVPALPYGIGFVRSYANFLGLNSSNIVELYKEEVMPKAGKQMFVLEPQSEASVPNKKYLLISLFAIALVYGGWSVLNNQDNSDESSVSNVEELAAVPQASEELPIIVEDFSAEPVMVTPDAAVANDDSQVVITEASFEGVAPAEPVAANTVAEPAPLVAAESTIVLNVKNETWVEVKDAEKLYLSKVLKAGTSYTVPQGKGMILSVGKADGLEVLVGGVVTPVVKPTKKMNILLDEYMKNNH